MTVREALWAECERLSTVLAGLVEADFDRPTGCPPWNVAELLAHVRTTLGRLPVMLGQPAPPRAEVDAAGYYGPAKFTPAVDAARVDGARREAGEVASGRELAEDFTRTWRSVRAALATEAPDRVVRTRHGDPMLLDEFLVTRVVEVGVHGLDLAAALDRPPWLTEPAARVVADLLLGGNPLGTDAPLGWDRLTFIRKATGRLPLSDAERAEIDRAGLRWLSFG
ncbi:maleylpyruvate isomerase N-terminal domain-containing protein [Micromonospora sp. NPDC049559]|uniref:maleylpyruvate isomerase N-terminal domain-containing protein n=1 Tax=Micromonospora sp. NPDC049559 TaxID=3155923 RepID=UPI0034495FF8